MKEELKEKVIVLANAAQNADHERELLSPNPYGKTLNDYWDVLKRWRVSLDTIVNPAPAGERSYEIIRTLRDVPYLELTVLNVNLKMISKK